MAELKPFEVIMRISPIAGQNGKGELVMQAEKFAEVVRCKDCKHYVPSEYSVDGAGFCKAIGRLTFPKSDDFCSRGERREE